MAESRFTAEQFTTLVDRALQLRALPIVVKLGGSAMEDSAATATCLKTLVTLNHLGIPLVLVHGGGKPIDRAMAAAGITPRKVAGRRYTDDATLAIVVRVLKGEINPAIVQGINERGGRSLAVTDALHGEQLLLPGLDLQPIELGRVGKIARVDIPRLKALLNRNTIPVIPCLALDADESWLNVNADTVAAAVGGAIGASRVLFLTDTPGVLSDRANPGSLIPRLTAAECRQGISTGAIDGGMVAKVEACLEALDAGVPSATILDGRQPYALLDALLFETRSGTEVIR